MTYQASSTATPPPLPPDSRPARDPLFDDILTGKNFFRVGLGLVLLAIVFLFRYAIQAGWIGPEVRVGAGAVVSMGMIAYGSVLARRRPSYGQLLAGGGVAGLYVTAFAAHQVYDMTGLAMAFTQLVAVAVLGVGLALRWRSEPLAIAGFGGALLAPLLIEGRMLPAFGGDAIYFAAVLGGVMALVFRHDWQRLYWATNVGSALVIGSEWLRLSFAETYADLAPSAPSRPELQIMIGIFWVAFFAVPVMARILEQGSGRFQALYGSLVVSPAAFLASSAVWDSLSDNRVMAAVALGLAAVHAAVAGSSADRELRLAQILPVGVFVGLAAVLVFDGPIVSVVLLAEAAGLVVVGRRTSFEWSEAAGHVAFAGASLWLMRLLPDLGEAARSVLNGDFLAVLAVPALAIPLGWFIGRDGTDSAKALGWGYAGLGTVVLAVAVWMELAPVSQALVTAVYALIALGLLVAGMASEQRLLTRAGLVGLAGVVAKLFIVDLAAAEPIWKIAAFSGIGLVLLVVGLWISNDD